MDKAKSIAHSRHRDDVTDVDELSSPGEPSLKFKNSASHKGPYEFDSIQRVQVNHVYSIFYDILSYFKNHKRSFSTTFFALAIRLSLLFYIITGIVWTACGSCVVHEIQYMRKITSNCRSG